MMPVERIRRKYHINVNDICRNCYISRTAYYNIISGKSSPTLKNATCIMEYLKSRVSVYETMTISYLFTDWENRNGNISDN